MLPADDLICLTGQLKWATLQPSAEPIVEKFTHCGVTYFFPKKDFANGAAIEYPIADDFYKKYSESETEADRVKFLTLLVATICREENPDHAQKITRGDERIPLNSIDEAKHRAVALENVQVGVLIAAKLYFEGVKLLVFQTYGEWLFPKGEKNEAEEDNRTEMGWWTAFLDVAASGPFGNLEKVYQTRFHVVALWMSRNQKRRNDLQQQQNFERAKAEAHD